MPTTDIVPLRREYLRLDSLAGAWRRDATEFGTPNIRAKANELTLRARAAYAAYVAVR